MTPMHCQRASLPQVHRLLRPHPGGDGSQLSDHSTLLLCDLEYPVLGVRALVLLILFRQSHNQRLRDLVPGQPAGYGARTRSSWTTLLHQLQQPRKWLEGRRLRDTACPLLLSPHGLKIQAPFTLTAYR